MEWTETVQQSQMNEGVEEYSYVETTIRNQETFLNKIFYFESGILFIAFLIYFIPHCAPFF